MKKKVIERHFFVVVEDYMSEEDIYFIADATRGSCC
jgi:hypothetical protein